VAERDGVPVGFMSLDLARGYLDLAFVLPQVMGQGVADALYAVLEARARAEGLARLTTEASALARPFFARNGWALIREQQVERRGVALHNAVMEKTLSPGETA
jgi:putative acetyltransferase